MASVRRVCERCLDQEAIQAWQDFMQQHEAAFEEVEGAKDEYRLECTDIHAQFQQLVEGQMETALSEVGHSTESFYKICSAVDGTDMGENLQAFVQFTLCAVDYPVFADIMRSREKREYYFFILRSWRSALSGDASSGRK